MYVTLFLIGCCFFYFGMHFNFPAAFIVAPIIMAVSLSHILKLPTKK